MTSKKISRTLELRVGGAGDALDRFEAAWNRVAEGRKEALDVLSVEDLPLLAQTLTPARWALLKKLAETPRSIYDLAGQLGRDYKNVHTDVAALLRIGLVERQPDGLVAVRWTRVRAELSLEG